MKESSRNARTASALGPLLLLLGALLLSASQSAVAVTAPDAGTPLWASHCERWSSFERGIWENLLFWQESGISEELMGRAIEALGTEPGRTKRVGVAVAIVNGTLYVARSTPLSKTYAWWAHNLLVWVHVLRRLVARWGPALPDVELLLGADDDPSQDVSLPDGWVAGPPLPVMKHCRSTASADITIPTWHFYTLNATTNFFSRTHHFNQDHPWAQREHKAYGGGLLYHRSQAMAANRKHMETGIAPGDPFMVRERFADFLNKEVKSPHIVFDAGRPLERWAAYKMAIHIDGISCSSKVWQLMALGSLVLREQSNYKAFYDDGLHSFEHYVPFWRHRPREVVWAYDWATRHDAAAARIAAAGQAYVRDMLTSQGLECYWLLLLQQYSGLLRYTPGGQQGARRVGAAAAAAAGPEAAAGAGVAAVPTAGRQRRRGGRRLAGLDGDGVVVGKAARAEAAEKEAEAEAEEQEQKRPGAATSGGGRGGGPAASSSGSSASSNGSSSSSSSSSSSKRRQQQTATGAGDPPPPPPPAAVEAFYVPVDRWLALQEGSHGWRPGLAAGLSEELELLPLVPMAAAARAAAQELAAAANATALRP
ncbi:hypothetical protein HYH02_007397 [Chlamydomonas schloesseri]|uniref:Glycosyl transferase CAP10 domain-containing protein n=1 Tax=Chlamydomonas schloesseri TaxID=2026947 RepID=A0A835WHR6_9CHLO|nr:hypothetical protein HYH02_007397 [Chlamydomonas schloesseri]|eukprot:KAG2447469.1 hypothetical protein HYH02_007397 [Chlamydomonas schloesseri]